MRLSDYVKENNSKHTPTSTQSHSQKDEQPCTHLAHVEQCPTRRLVVRTAATTASASPVVRHHVHRQREDGADLVVAQPERGRDGRVRIGGGGGRRVGGVVRRGGGDFCGGGGRRHAPATADVAAHAAAAASTDIHTPVDDHVHDTGLWTRPRYYAWF